MIKISLFYLENAGNTLTTPTAVEDEVAGVITPRKQGWVCTDKLHACIVKATHTQANKNKMSSNKALEQTLINGLPHNPVCINYFNLNLTESIYNSVRYRELNSVNIDCKYTCLIICYTHIIKLAQSLLYTWLKKRRRMKTINHHQCGKNVYWENGKIT